MINKLKYAAASVVVGVAWVIGMVLFDYDMVDEWSENEDN
jgi:hypothetical protein